MKYWKLYISAQCINITMTVLCSAIGKRLKNKPSCLPVQVVWARKRVRWLQHRRSVQVLHPPWPRPLHTLWDLGGGLQPTRNGHFWRHLPGYPRRGWVRDLRPLLRCKRQVFSSWPACNLRVALLVNVGGGVTNCIGPSKRHQYLCASYRPTYSRIPEKPYSPRF